MNKDKDLIGIAFSDLHSQKFKVRDRNGSRLDWTLKAFKEIAMVANENQVPLFFNGDWFHTPKDVENETLWKTISAYKDYVEIVNTKVFAISGNHDLCEKNGKDHRSPSYLNTFAEVFKTFNLLDESDTPRKINTTGGKAFVWGLPYYNSEKELRARIKELKPIAKGYNGYKILMLHADCPGAIENSGMKLGETPLGKQDELDKFFKPWDLVLFGHIHLPQQLSKKCIMVGSPIHQISSDTVQMGYWKIFSTQPPKFYGLVNYPKFITLEKGQKPWNNLDYFIEYEEAVEIETIKKGEFTLDQSRAKLAKKYMKKKGIKDKARKRALINVLNSVE